MSSELRVISSAMTYVGRTETERKPYQYRVILRYVERTQQEPIRAGRELRISKTGLLREFELSYDMSSGR